MHAENFTLLPPLLADIWAAYRELKAPTLAPSSLKDFRKVDRALAAAAITGLRATGRDARMLWDAAVRLHGKDFARRVFVQVRAACGWAYQMEMIQKNPFEGWRMPRLAVMAPDPFSKAEFKRIIWAMEKAPEYSLEYFYLDFVRFAFLTGARPSEIIPLRWDDVDLREGIIFFRRSLVEGHLREQPKTGHRRFPINKQLRGFLAPLAHQHGTVFHSPNGGSLINLGNFSRRCWGPLLQKCRIRQRGIYHARHSFISWALEGGATVTQVSRWCGTSPTMIHRHYAGVFGSVPEI